jgi:hypothetical protein
VPLGCPPARRSGPPCCTPPPREILTGADPRGGKGGSGGWSSREWLLRRGRGGAPPGCPPARRSGARPAAPWEEAVGQIDTEGKGNAEKLLAGCCEDKTRKHGCGVISTSRTSALWFCWRVPNANAGCRRPTKRGLRGMFLSQHNHLNTLT